MADSRCGSWIQLGALYLVGELQYKYLKLKYWVKSVAITMIFRVAVHTTIFLKKDENIIARMKE